MKASQSIARRSVTSVAWNVVASMTGVVVGLVRSVALAQLLPISVFGVYAWAGSIVTLSAVVADFGFGGAFIHRSTETEDEEQTAAVHFTLQLIFTSVWAATLVSGALVFARGQTRIVLLLLTATAAGTQLARTPRLILGRRVVHRRLALVRFLDTVFSALVAISLAWRGLTIWALLSTNLVTLLINVVAFYVWRPVWRPRLTWSPPVIKYFLRFGSRNVLAIALSRALDRVDDLWTGAFLGNDPLSFYSRAYRFATYPRTILAAPINMVAGGTYAELTGNRKRLSRAFFRTNAFLLRSGFLLAGLLALVAPEFIRLGLGAKWLPMLDAFRLMLIYTLFDPIKATVAHLFVAVGKPGQIVQARVVQLIVLVIGLFLLGPLTGITGVALAVDFMLVVGIAILLWQARSFVDFSPRRLFAAPALGLVFGMLLAYRASTLPAIAGSDWRTGLVKIIVFTGVYGASLLALEWRQTWEMLLIFRQLFRRSASSQPEG